MSTIKNEDILNEFLGNDRLEKLVELSNIVSKTETKNDDFIYNNMLKLINYYSMHKSSNLYLLISLRNTIRKYYDVCYKIIISANNNEYSFIQDIYNTIENFTKNDLDYKILIFNEFQKLGIIEERTKYELVYYDAYKKLMQIMSVKYKKGYSKESNELYEKSNAKVIYDKAKLITTKVIDLNKKSMLISQDDFVKPTNSILEICNCLPELIVDNEDMFMDLIDYLYKMFWESHARNYNIRNELDFINNIRTYYRHDIEHGKKSDIKKKYKRITDFYQLAINKEMPINAKDWQKVQIFIYDTIISFLDGIVISKPKE